MQISSFRSIYQVQKINKAQRLNNSINGGWREKGRLPKSGNVYSEV